MVPMLVFFASAAKGQDTAKTDSLEIYDEIILEHITVVGKQDWVENIPGSAGVITQKILEKQSYSDVNRVLRQVPGVYIQEEDGFGLRPNVGLRGTGVERSSKITLMEDGVLIAPAPYAAPAAYYFPTVGRMSGIEVRKGSSQVKFGPNTNGGALNLRSTRIPYELSGKADVSFGDHGTRKIHANIGDSNENFGYLLETYQMSNSGFKKLDNGDDTGFDTKDFVGKLMWRSDADANIYQRLEAKFGYYDEVSNETYLGLTESDYTATPNRRYAASQMDNMDADHTQLQLRHFAMFSDRLDLTTTIYQNKFNRNWYKLNDVNGVGIGDLLDTPRQYSAEYNIARGSNSNDDGLHVKANNRGYTSRGIQSSLAYDFSTGSVDSELEVGARYHKDEVDRYQWIDGYRMDSEEMIQTSAGVPGTESNRIEKADALALFIQDELSAGKWTLTPGVRYEHINMKKMDYGTEDTDRTGTDLTVNNNSLDVFVPGMGINFAATESLKVFAGIHKGFTPPGPGASEGTEAEQSVNYELGSRYSKKSFKAEFVTFYNDYSNLLGNDLAAAGGGGTTEQYNAGEVNVIGIEASLNYDLAESNSRLLIPLSLNYTFTSAKFQNSFESDYGAWGNVEEGYELPYLPKHQFNGSIGMEMNSWAVNLNAYSTAAMRTVASSGSINSSNKTDAYYLLDLSTSYRVSEIAQLFMNIRNVTDATYIVSRRPAGIRPGLPRTFMGGLKITF